MIPPHFLKRTIRRAQLVGLLAPTLGQEKSEAKVAEAAKSILVPLGDEVRVDHVLAVLDHLASEPGLVGVAARFVRARGELETLVGAPPESLRLRPAPTMAPAAGVQPNKVAAGTRVTFEEIALFVAPAVGDAVARDAVAIHAASLGIRGPDTTRAEASQILDKMSQAEGILGVVASFAKARFILKYPP